MRQPLKKQAGLNSFVMTPKRWIESTNAIGIVSKAGRYGGTFAHKDIALEFITEHIKNVFSEGELEEEVVCRDFRPVYN